MQTSWTEPDAGAPPPTLDRLVVSVREIRFVPVQAPAALLELAQVLRSLLVNGGVVVETFEVEADEVAAWFLSRNNFDTYGLLEQLLKSEAVTRAAPVLGAFDARAASRTFEQTSSLHLDGDLAGALVLGRGLRRVRGVATPTPNGSAWRCATRCSAMPGRTCASTSPPQPWSPWFFDVAWDHSWVVTDLRAQRMTLLCLTDTD